MNAYTLRRAIAGTALAVAMTAAGTGGTSAQQMEMNDSLTALAQAADGEGQLVLSWSASTFAGSEGTRMIEQAMNRLFGTNIRVTFVPGASNPQIGNQMAALYRAGQKADSDVYFGTAANMLPLLPDDFFASVDWQGYLPDRIGAEIVEMDSRFIRVVTGVSAVTYNAELAPMEPKTMDDFLRPEWKGKIATTPYIAGFDVLAAEGMWGPERTLDYITKLSDQVSGLIRCGETERIASGEYLALVLDCTGQDALLWQERGAPIASMIPRDAAQKRFFYFAVPKHAPNINAAKLFTVFMMTPQGQDIAWRTYKADLDTFPESNMGKQIAALEAEGVTFQDVSVPWVLEHENEVQTVKDQATKILARK